jgi:hypothetical protein
MSDTPRTKAATRMAFTSEYMVEIEEAQKLERELAEVTKQRGEWKANHDNQVAINRTLRDRPDLGERAKLVDALTKQRDALAEALELFLSRVRYTSVFMNGNPTGGTFDYRSHGFDAEVELAHKALAATKGGSHE